MSSASSIDTFNDEFSMDDDQTIFVALRIRPGNAESADCLTRDVSSANSILLENVQNVSQRSYLQSPYAKERFTFDHVLDSSSSQEETFNACVKDLISSSVLSGINATILAYGQTGSGKTYTMAGCALADRCSLTKCRYSSNALSGIIIRSSWQLFQDLTVLKENALIHVSVVEIYNEEIMLAVELDEKETNILLKLLRNQTSKSNSYNDIIKHILTKARKTEEEFNGNPYLLGFNNGVYDLLNDEFRDYTFNDYITLTTKYDYKKPDYEIPENFALRDELATLIETIHPDPDYRLLYLQTLASGLDGRAYQKLFLFNGQGGNGKGLTGSLMDITLGEYYHQPGNGILKDVEKANTPSPDMINLKHKRYINFKEVAGTIRVAVLRNLTGGGKFCGRYLNQNPETFFMSATFVMEFNNSPELDGKPQRADYRRLVDLFFPINFTDDPNKIDKEIGGLKYKKANTIYETQEFFNSIRDIFLDMLLGVYRTYKDTEKKTGIVFTIPEIIRKKTDEFIANQNLFVKIFNTNWLRVDIKPDDIEDEKRKTIALIDMWEDVSNSNEYKCLSYRDKRQYNRNEFYKWVEENFVVVKPAKSGKIIKGIIRNTNGEDDDENDGEENIIENEFIDEE